MLFYLFFLLILTSSKLVELEYLNVYSPSILFSPPFVILLSYNANR